MKKKICMLILCCFIAMVMVCFSVYAKKDRILVDYSIPCNILFKEENPGLKVKKEQIEFDIDLKNDGFNTVRTQYVLENVTNEKINAKVYLPLLYYQNGDDQFRSNYLDYLEATKQISVLNDTNQVSYQKRFFFQTTEDILQLGIALDDTYLEDDFYNQNLKWTKYTYQISDLSTNQNGACTYTIEVEFPSNFQGVTFVEGCKSVSYVSDHNKIKATLILDQPTYVQNASIFIYTTNQNIENVLPYATIYANNREKTNNHLELVEKENILHDDVVYTFYDEDKEVSRIDWYNSVIKTWDEHSYSKYSFHLFDYNQLDIYHRLQSCIEYDIELGANSTAITEIKMPIKGAKMDYYHPTLYSYLYEFSKQSYVQDIGQVKIIIRTNGYVNKVSLGDTLQIDDYYEITLYNIENENFYFNVSRSKSYPTTIIGRIMIRTALFILTIAILIPVFIIGVVLLCKRKFNKKQLVMYFLQLIGYIFIFSFCFFHMIVGSNNEVVLFVLVFLSLVALIIEKIITKRKTFGRLSIIGIQIILMVINTVLFYHLDSKLGISTEGIVLIYTTLLIMITIYNMIQLKEQGTKHKQLPIGYLKKSEYQGLVLLLITLLCTVFVVNMMFSFVSIASIIIICIGLFIIYLIIGVLIMQFIHQKPFRKFRKDLNINQLEKAMAKKLGNLDINDEYRNFLMMIYITHICLYNKEKATILQMSVIEPKTKSYQALFDSFSITIMTKVEEYQKKIQVLREKYQKKKAYLKLIDKFDEKYVAMTTGIAKIDVDKLLNTNTKYEEDNAIHLFQKVFYYYHQGNTTKANALKEQFLKKYSQLNVLVNILKNEHYFEEDREKL